MKISLAQHMVAYTLEKSPSSERYTGYIREIKTGLCFTAGHVPLHSLRLAHVHVACYQCRALLPSDRHVKALLHDRIWLG